MKLLITGAAGLLGKDVAHAALGAGHELVALSRAQLDICDVEAVGRVVDRTAPDVIVNCAAYTKVDDAESDQAAAAAVNEYGAAALATATLDVGAWLLHISTDYVFDGRKTSGPYVESDPVSPTSVYGGTKLAGEGAIMRIAPENSTIVRTSWLFGAGGPCFPATMLRLARERGSLSVVDDQRGCPTYTPHLAAALMTLASARLPGVVHVAGAGECSWFEFAREIVAISGEQATVSPCSTAEFPRPARRPAYSVLRSERGAEVPLLPDWRRGLSEYMANRGAAAARGDAGRA